jgi:hypothetical protein
MHSVLIPRLLSQGDRMARNDVLIIGAVVVGVAEIVWSKDACHAKPHVIIAFARFVSTSQVSAVA